MRFYCDNKLFVAGLYSEYWCCEKWVWKIMGCWVIDRFKARWNFAISILETRRYLRGWSLRFHPGHANETDSWLVTRKKQHIIDEVCFYKWYHEVSFMVFPTHNEHYWWYQLLSFLESQRHSQLKNTEINDKISSDRLRRNNVKDARLSGFGKGLGNSLYWLPVGLR